MDKLQKLDIQTPISWVNTVSALKNAVLNSMGNRRNVVRYKEISYKGEDSFLN